ncbi:hypothetical protein BDZ88DRAFT_428328 [Geranomyces variabilis]|nr:hypothetical protein BDZ88DRAFT_428328 [Geranomyces variabilis]KAJ3138594.1 Abscission/NoCut checkpoint regulator [Geranomyces variabilis]
MADPDKDLRDRFEALKADKAALAGAAPLPTDEELFTRLKSLVGKDLVAPPPPSSTSRFSPSSPAASSNTITGNTRSYALAPNTQPTALDVEDDDEIASLLLTTNLLSDVDVDVGYEDERMDVPSIPLPGSIGAAGAAAGSSALSLSQSRPAAGARGHSFDGKFVDYTNLVLTSPTRGRGGLDYLDRRDDDDDDDVREIMEKVGAEVALEGKFGVSSSAGAGDEEDNDFQRRLRGLKEFVPSPDNKSVVTTSGGGGGGGGSGGGAGAGAGTGGGGAQQQQLPRPSLGPPPRAPSLEDFADTEDDDERWCCVCSDDATVVCEVCDNDMYCQSCFRKEHAMDDEIRHHVAKNLPASKQK